MNISMEARASLSPIAAAAFLRLQRPRQTFVTIFRRHLPVNTSATIPAAPQQLRRSPQQLWDRQQLIVLRPHLHLNKKKPRLLQQ